MKGKIEEKTVNEINVYTIDIFGDNNVSKKIHLASINADVNAARNSTHLCFLKTWFSYSNYFSLPFL